MLLNQVKDLLLLFSNVQAEGARPNCAVRAIFCFDLAPAGRSKRRQYAISQILRLVSLLLLRGLYIISEGRRRSGPPEEPRRLPGRLRRLPPPCLGSVRRPDRYTLRPRLGTIRDCAPARTRKLCTASTASWHRPPSPQRPIFATLHTHPPLPNSDGCKPWRGHNARSRRLCSLHRRLIPQGRSPHRIAALLFLGLATPKRRC